MGMHLSQGVRYNKMWIRGGEQELYMAKDADHMAGGKLTYGAGKGENCMPLQSSMIG